MLKPYLQMQKKLTLYNWQKLMVKYTEMDFTGIDSGKNKIKKTKLSFLSVKISNHFWFKNKIFIVIIGTKYAIFLMGGLFNTFTTGFNTTQTKTSKKEDGHLFKTLSSLFSYNTLEKRNGRLFQNASKTEAKFKSEKDSVIFLTLKSPKIHGQKNKFKSFKIRPNNSSINGGELFSYRSLRGKLTIFYGENSDL